MNLRHYQLEAMKTYACPEHIPAQLYTPFLLLEEIGEFSELFSKAMRDGHAIAYDRLVKELGDILWSMAAFDHTKGRAWSNDIVFRDDAGENWFEDRELLQLDGHPSKKYLSLSDVDAVRFYVSNIISFRSFQYLCDVLEISSLEVAKTNLAKLADRKSRGVIHGEGDER